MKRFSPTVIGAFVVAGFALLIAAVIVVGSGSLLRRPYRFVCMFAGDLNGLKPGAAVKVRGVQVGTVSEIKLILSPSEGRVRPGVTEMRFPVFIDIDRNLIAKRGGTGEALRQVGFDRLMTKGMRAQLAAESLLTGVLYVDLDLHPGTSADLVLVPGSGPYREIPTVPTAMEALQAKLTKTLEHLQDTDFQALASSLKEAADAVKDLTSSPALKATLETLRDTTSNLNKTVLSFRQAIEHADARLDPLLVSLRQNSDELNAVMRQTRAVLISVQATMDPDSPIVVHLDTALEQMTYTTRSIGELTDYLQRNPASLVRGKYVKDGEAGSR